MLNSHTGGPAEALEKISIKEIFPIIAQRSCIHKWEPAEHKKQKTIIFEFQGLEVND